MFVRLLRSICSIFTLGILLTLLVLSHAPVATAAQTNINGPAGSGLFGTNVVVLPSGNIVVVDTGFDESGLNDIGAVYLYDGATLGLISTLKGGKLNDNVGSGGITVLTNGNYVVYSPNWDNGAAVNVGALTWCSGSTGCAGVVSTANSLYSPTTNDAVASGGGITVLTNGNYVVRSPRWDTVGALNVGAVTWCSGTTGCSGVVSATNSLYGSTADDQIGSEGVTALTNGNYVVQSPGWDNGSTVGVGAATLCNGTTGCTGAVTTGNSLYGVQTFDSISNGGVLALTNGNYVVKGSNWDNGSIANAGAVTWCSGTTGCTGAVTTANSLYGTTAEDRIGFSFLALANGNFVVSSLQWDNSGTVDVGVATWCNGATGCTGAVTTANSLHGSTANDRVSTVTALTNGNYVVSSTIWDNGGILDVGIVTLCSGTTGCTGAATTADSLYGSATNDNVGGVTALTNGNYVVTSSRWDNGGTPDVGAITWCDGTTGCTGAVTTTNSLYGPTANDQVSGAVPLTNGNYVVTGSQWDNGSTPNVGAVTLCSGETGCTGAVTTANSLYGSKVSDQVGSVTALTNGNYLVTSFQWDNATLVDVGAVTWCSGTTGCVGAVTTSNSLYGSTTSDFVGSVSALANGNYVVLSNNWDNPSGPITDARAVSFGNGTGGTVGAISSANSLIGTITNGISTFSFDALRNRVFVGRGASNIVSVLYFETTAVSNGNLSNAATWDNGVPTALTNVTIPSGRTVTVSSSATIGSLNVASGGTLTLNANLTVGGLLTLGTQIDVGSNTLTLTCSTETVGASSSNYVRGNVQKQFCAPTAAWSYPTSGTDTNGGAARGAFTYPVGTASGYSPVETTMTAGGLYMNRTNIFTVYGINPQSLTVRANSGTAPASPALVTASTLQRYWTLTETGDLTANVKFNYLDGDVNGSEGSYEIIRVPDSGQGLHLANGSPCPGGGSPCVDTAANTLYVAGLSSFSDWTAGYGSPTDVMLLKFAAKHNPKKNVVRVKWQTGNELDVVGFNLYRASKKDGKYKKLNDALVPARKAGQVMGDRYKRVNKRVKPGKSYFYKLEIVKRDGTSEWAEIVRVRAR